MLLLVQHFKKRNFNNFMIYSNDEADKSIRQKKFILTVYAVPIITTIIICCLVYFGTKLNVIPEKDTFYGYITSLTPGIILYAFNRKNWLKMPDGTFHFIKDLQTESDINYKEPNVYEAEFFNSFKDKAITSFWGLIAIGGGIWLGLKSSNTILIPIGTSLLGAFLAYTGIKGLIDKTAKLKIAKNGLWTKKLGFKNWDEINFAEVVIDKSGKQPQTILEIRLKGTKFDEANQPDERLNLTELKYKDDIEMIINNSIFQYNEHKKQSSS